MKQILKRLASGMLACAMLALTACGGTADPSGSAPESGGDAAQTAKGRYIEEQIALPEGVGTIRTINQLAVAQKLFIYSANKQFEGYITSKSVTDIYYLTHRLTHNDVETRKILSKLFTLFHLLDTTSSVSYTHLMEGQKYQPDLPFG